MKYTIQALKAKIDTLGTAYYDYAVPSAVYPYLVYNIDVVVTNFKTQTADLTINVWSDNLTEVIELADSVWKGLDGYCVANGNTSVYVRRAAMLNVPDPDAQIFRKQLNFIVLFEEV